MTQCEIYDCQRPAKQRVTIQWTATKRVAQRVYCHTHAGKLAVGLAQTGKAATARQDLR